MQTWNQYSARSSMIVSQGHKDEPVPVRAYDNVMIGGRNAFLSYEESLVHCISSK